MDNAIIIIDSDDEECAKQETKSKTSVSQVSPQNGKRPKDLTNENDCPPIKQRRIQPQKIGEVEKKVKIVETSSSQETTSDLVTKDSSTSITTYKSTESEESPKKESKIEDVPSTSADIKKEKHKNEVTKELEAFINACRKSENNSDMKKIIKSKLMKYYDLVHPDYAQSKYLRKLFEDTALAILRDPKTVYSKLQDVINELKSRKNCGPVTVVEQPKVEVEKEPEKKSEENGGTDEIQTTGDEKKDNQLRKLNKALTKLKKAIEDLEEAEVNLDEEEDSAYMKKVRYEKRAVEIYNKICEITGESTHAHRIIKQPIKFKGTDYKEFNRRLSKKINKENGFPSYYDVFRLLDFCNKEYKYKLLRDEIQTISQLAFVEVGKLLKERRCNDLYESAEHYAGKNKDPAKEDPELKTKLEKNKEIYKKRTEEILQFYVAKQLRGENGEDDENDVEIGESSNSKENIENGSVESKDDADEELQNRPTKNIIIDIKTECDINGEKNDTPVIDLAISL
ncbi:daxx-like protein [Chironomus tepperi]|uniref:daxx-like protein n=1 Tax=Chironomus tepperi TaxID=113505 RepID=UPI00391EFA0A